MFSHLTEDKVHTKERSTYIIQPTLFFRIIAKRPPSCIQRVKSMTKTFLQATETVQDGCINALFFPLFLFVFFFFYLVFTLVSLALPKQCGCSFFVLSGVNPGPCPGWCRFSHLGRAGCRYTEVTSPLLPHRVYRQHTVFFLKKRNWCG